MVSKEELFKKIDKFIENLRDRGNKSDAHRTLYDTDRVVLMFEQFKEKIKEM